MKSRLTDLRQRILDVIDQAEKPLNVKMIEKRVSSRPNLSTIYRALDFLKKNSFIHSISFSSVTFYYSNRKGHGHFLICSSCHEIQEFEDCVVDNLQKRLQEKYDYRITDHVLCFNGLCSECQNYLDKKVKAMS
jgi:Fur family ferric uptake transcriptional regulator